MSHGGGEDHKKNTAVPTKRPEQRKSYKPPDDEQKHHMRETKRGREILVHSEGSARAANLLNLHWGEGGGGKITQGRRLPHQRTGKCSRGWKETELSKNWPARVKRGASLVPNGAGGWQIRKKSSTPLGPIQRGHERTAAMEKETERVEDNLTSLR